jgi:hypothetical protein
MSKTIALAAGGTIAPIVPRSIEEVYRLAQGIAASGLAPKGMDKAEQVTVAILTGLEIGLPPMFAVQKIAVINGRPAIWGDAVPAILYARGFKLREWDDGDTAYCEVTRPDGDKIVRSFSDDQAKRAGLLGKAGPWTQYRERMRQMRARGFACRDGAADALSGLYLREELDEPPMRDITPAPAIDDIPEPPEPDNQPDTSKPYPDDPPDIPEDTEADTPIADVDGYLAKLAEDVALCDSETELAEIAEANAGMIARLPKAAQRKARTLLEAA